MEFRHFVTFKKIIETGSFTQAAEQLGYTQSTVTSHIQALEKHLEVPLFDRMGRTIKLTAIGQELSRYSQDLLDTYKKIESIALDGEMVGGELVIAAPESLTVYRLEPILREYRKKFPHVHIRLSNATCGDNKQAILNGQADLAFIITPKVQDVDLIGHTLAEEPIVLVGSPDSTLNHLGEETSHQKLAECLIVNEKECSYRTIFEDYIQERGITPVHIMELWSIEAIKRCVMSELGIACLPLVTVNDEIAAGKLKVISCDRDLEPIFSQVVYHKNKWISPALAAFIDITMKHATEWSVEKLSV